MSDAARSRRAALASVRVMRIVCRSHDVDGRDNPPQPFHVLAHAEPWAAPPGHDVGGASATELMTAFAQVNSNEPRLNP